MKRIWHPWTSWECYKAGFYETVAPDGMTPDAAREAYREFLASAKRFDHALQRVLSEWVMSCEHFLSNESLNRIAWLGQASMCIATRVPSCFRGGFKLLEPQQQREANALADDYLNKWLRRMSEADRRLYRDVGSARLC